MALTLAALGVGLLVSGALGAPVAAADATGNASDAGLQRDTNATKHAVSQAFPYIEQISGFRPDPHGEHDDGRALDILIPGDPRPARRASHPAIRSETSCSPGTTSPILHITTKGGGYQ